MTTVGIKGLTDVCHVSGVVERTSDVKKTRALEDGASEETVIVSDLLAGVEPTISSNV